MWTRGRERRCSHDRAVTGDAAEDNAPTWAQNASVRACVALRRLDCRATFSNWCHIARQSTPLTAPRLPEVFLGDQIQSASTGARSDPTKDCTRPG